MLRILLSGCNGRMGQAVTKLTAKSDGIVIVAGIDLYKTGTEAYPVYDKPTDFTGEADIIVDFSNASALTGLVDYALSRNMPLLIATTGLAEDQIELLKEASAKIPVFRTGNMSLGVNILCELVKKTAKILGEGFDIEIVEKHHNTKVDAPSGTALMLAEAAKEGVKDAKYVYERQSRRQKREKNEIGIHSIRGGTIVGEHEVIFAGFDEVITLSHSASSRELFATGALKAAVFLAEQKPGLYSMADVVGSI
jgi:4-hydroxy-tetrahydrodipicolinate reductase